MAQQEEAAQVTVTVLSGRNLQGKRKGDVFHASVVFGIGKELYCTESVEGSDPEWHQEAVINIPSRLSSSLGLVKFKLRDKEHTVAIVQLQVSDLPRRCGSPKWHPLKPYRKTVEVQGELKLNCWVSQTRAVQTMPSSAAPHETQTSTGSGGGGGGGGLGLGLGVGGGGGVGSRRVKEYLGLGETSGSGGGGVMKRLGSLHRRTQSGGKVIVDDSPTGSGGSGNTCSSIVVPTSSGHSGLEQAFQSRMYKSDSSLRSHSPELDQVVFKQPVKSLAPEVTGISPHEGLVSGNERVVLRGSNLGESRADIVRIEVAEVDCTSSLEYFSPAKLAITTFPRHASGSGPIVIETVTGGVGVSSVTFTYVRQRLKTGGVSLSGSNIQISKSNNADLVEARKQIKALKQEVKDLKDENKQLKEANKSLRDYLEKLMVGIIEKHPELLEVPHRHISISEDV